MQHKALVTCIRYTTQRRAKGSLSDYTMEKSVSIGRMVSMQCTPSSASPFTVRDVNVLKRWKRDRPVCRSSHCHGKPCLGLSSEKSSVGKLNRRTVLNGVCCSSCFCMGRGGWYDKFFAYVMATGMERYEAAVAPVKNELFDTVWLESTKPRNILEIGIGTGPNLKYIKARSGSADIRITGVDPNKQMLPYLQEEAERVGLTAGQMNVKEGVAEALPLPDASIDLCISTLVLCSVTNVPQVIQEVKRVLKPGGQYLFLEHVIAPEDKPLLRLAQKALTPVQALLADGCHLNRNPLPSIKDALEVHVAQEFAVEDLGIIGPHVAGVAVRTL
eukprot:jgi/Botrbrau1/16594/Bobra.0068s0024.1